jgi:phosphate transport system substrate-binding protein
VLNSAGYYTEPTAQNVAVSLLKAQIDMNKSDPLYLTQDLSQVYTDPDPRTYELSSYSYMILPTDTSFGLTNAKGLTLGAFGSYLLCQGQQQVDALGYSALPINLVEAGYQQLQKIPGNQVPTATAAQIQGCNNPTFSTNGTNTLADTDPNPPACDKQGSTQCTTGTGGAAKTSTPVKASAQGNQASNGVSSTHGSSSASASTSAAAGSNGASQGCDPDSGACGVGTDAAGTAGGPPTVNGVAVSAAVGLGNSFQVALMVLAGALLVCLVLIPPLIVQAGRRRQQRRFGRPGPGAFR